jgi:hypothetical protein
VGKGASRRAHASNKQSEWVEYSDIDQPPRGRAQNTVVSDATVFDLCLGYRFDPAFGAARAARALASSRRAQALKLAGLRLNRRRL